MLKIPKRLISQLDVIRYTLDNDKGVDFLFYKCEQELLLQFNLDQYPENFRKSIVNFQLDKKEQYIARSWIFR